MDVRKDVKVGGQCSEAGYVCSLALTLLQSVGVDGGSLFLTAFQKLGSHVLRRTLLGCKRYISKGQRKGLHLQVF